MEKQSSVRVVIDFGRDVYALLVRVAERLNITKGAALVYAISLALMLLNAKAGGWKISLQRRGEVKAVPDL